MFEVMELFIPGFIIFYLKRTRSKVLSWAVKNPVLALSLVILTSAIVLPLVSAAALMPVVAILNIGDYLESKGLLTVMYAIFCQGIILAVFMVVLFFIAFTIATGVSVLHSYNFFQPVSEIPKNF